MHDSLNCEQPIGNSYLHENLITEEQDTPIVREAVSEEEQMADFNALN